MKVTCPKCDGSGMGASELSACKFCSGDGAVESVDVKIPLSDKIWAETTISDIMIEANNLFAQRNKEYGNSFAEYDPVMSALFPDGINLKTPIDFRRYGMVCAIIDKLVRYCHNFEKGHPDSIVDASVYCHMLAYVDKNRT